MPSKKSLDEIRKNLASLQKYDLVVYGSYSKGTRTARSDIDVAVITRKKEYAENVKIWKALLGKVPLPYGLKIFELLPLDIQMGIIENHRVLFGNALDLSEYFYTYRKAWNDVRQRFQENQFSSIRQKIVLMRAAKAAGF
ncbi:nucleotidyltransferase domain-containing protein [Candidatus Woesearchaeota archaeon]|nr:nucleotidyltransferase domain-containing protein [Candidatus Woesearchaeota archaeon]